jgi:hypothetical protein
MILNFWTDPRAREVDASRDKFPPSAGGHVPPVDPRRTEDFAQSRGLCDLPHQVISRESKRYCADNPSSSEPISGFSLKNRSPHSRRSSTSSLAMGERGGRLSFSLFRREASTRPP